MGWRPSRSRLDAAAVDLSGEVATEIHRMCQAAIANLPGLVRRPFGGSPYIEAGEEYLAVPAGDLPRLPNNVAEAVADDEGAALSDLERLITTAGLASLSRDELKHGRYLFYAAICRENGTGARLGFVRQADPHRVAKEGGLMARFTNGLQQLDDPVFVLESDFDLVVAPDEIAVLRIEAFNRMFADLNTIVAAAPANAEAIAETVQNMTPEATSALARAAASRPSIARRLQRLRRPGAIPGVTPPTLADALAKHGLDPGLIVAGDVVSFGEENAPVFLDLLEQLYYETDFTGEHRRADRYSPLGADVQQ